MLPIRGRHRFCRLLMREKYARIIRFFSGFWFPMMLCMSLCVGTLNLDICRDMFLSPDISWDRAQHGYMHISVLVWGLLHMFCR